MRVLSLVLLAGCAGPSGETLLDSLQVVSVIAEPPEIGPDDQVALSVAVADPLGDGADIAVWACFGEDCTEVGSGPSADGVLDVVYAIPLLEVPPGGFPAVLWALACAPGVCNVAAVEPTADPAEVVADLPFDGVSLTSKRVWVTDQPPEARNANPVISAEIEGFEATVGEEVVLPFAVSDDALSGARSWAYTTGGGFEGTDRSAADGAFEWPWFAPDVAGEVELFVVVDDVDGGSALWRRRVTVVE